MYSIDNKCHIKKLRTCLPIIKASSHISTYVVINSLGDKQMYLHTNFEEDKSNFNKQECAACKQCLFLAVKTVNKEEYHTIHSYKES